MKDFKTPIMIRTQTRECGSLKFDPICLLCLETNYPMMGWDMMEEEAWICLDCIETATFKLHHYEEPEEK